MIFCLVPRPLAQNRYLPGMDMGCFNGVGRGDPNASVEQHLENFSTRRGIYTCKVRRSTLLVGFLKLNVLQNCVWIVHHDLPCRIQ